MSLKITCAAVVLAWPAVVMAGAEQQPAGGGGNGAQDRAAAQPVHERPSPSIVWHKDGRPADTRDARVEAGGGMKISRPGAWPPGPARADGVIEVPNNTLGPGTPLWLVRDRENAERKIVEAAATVAQREAERAHPRHDAYGYGSGLYFVPGGGFSALGHLAGPGLHGPLATSIGRDDLLGATARQRFGDAAYPRPGPDQEARDRAVQRFGRDATPPVRRIEEEREKAFRDAQKEKPAEAPRPAEPPK